MNISRFETSYWIVIIILVLCSIFLFQTVYVLNEPYMNYPQQIDPMGNSDSNPDIASANNNYSELLLFLQNNPSKSGAFISDIKNKFFTDNCTIKSDIDFNNLAQMPNGLPFA
jgi:hypothetical protein